MRQKGTKGSGERGSTGGSRESQQAQIAREGGDNAWRCRRNERNLEDRQCQGDIGGLPLASGAGRYPLHGGRGDQLGLQRSRRRRMDRGAGNAQQRLRIMREMVLVLEGDERAYTEVAQQDQRREQALRLPSIRAYEHGLVSFPGH